MIIIKSSVMLLVDRRRTNALLHGKYTYIHTKINFYSLGAGSGWRNPNFPLDNMLHYDGSQKNNLSFLTVHPEDSMARCWFKKPTYS